MISQTSLLKALDDELRVCDSAHHESGAKGRERQILEHARLLPSHMDATCGRKPR